MYGLVALGKPKRTDWRNPDLVRRHRPGNLRELERCSSVCNLVVEEQASNIACRMKRNGIRLLWREAKTEYCGGSDLNSVAWYRDNSNGTTHPVGLKQANGYGLYDMSGNVWQWMENKYDNEHDWRVRRGALGRCSE